MTYNLLNFNFFNCSNVLSHKKKIEQQLKMLLEKQEIANMDLETLQNNQTNDKDNDEKKGNGFIIHTAIIKH